MRQPFNITTVAGKADEYLAHLVANPQLVSQGHFVHKCEEWFAARFPNSRFYFTNSCTQALELITLLYDIKPGDEIIMPSYTFVATANAFVLRGAVPVFVDIRPDTMNINENLIEAAITSKTRAIVVVHYAGLLCNMEVIENICQKHDLLLFEDAAHAIAHKAENEFAGSYGNAAAISFDQMKNISCGQGGVAIINDAHKRELTEVIYENGTDKRKFFRGEVPFYSWAGMGANFKMSEWQAASLWAQLEIADEILNHRMLLWERYYTNLKPLVTVGDAQLPDVAKRSEHNAHIFYLKLANKTERTKLINHLAALQISTVFHYIPLHGTEYGKSVSRFSGKDEFTSKESKRLLRLPLYHTLMPKQVDIISEAIIKYYQPAFLSKKERSFE